MKNLIKVGIIAFAFGMIFISVDTANAQGRGKQREARREYREDIRDARQDRRKDLRSGKSRREANRDFREEKRDAKRDYRRDTGRRINRGYYVSRSRRAYPQKYRVYYRNGRRYVRSY